MRNFTLTAAPVAGAQDVGSSKRLTRGWTTLLGLAFVFLMLSPLSMYAQHPYGFLDEDVRSNDGLLDWEDIWIAQQSNDYSLLPAGSITTDILFDAAAPDTIYFGGNTKDHLPISGWDWQSSMGSSSDKTNILESGAILIDGKIYFFGNKFASEGTTTIGFWFFQDDVSIDPSGGFNGEHTIGDILIVADIEQGGAVGFIRAYKYVGEGNGTLPSSNKAFIELSTTDGTLAGVVNTLEQATPWPHQSKNYPPNMLPPITFFEGFIDLAALDLTNACFSSFLMETRSSNPVNSALEDFNLGGFNVTPSVSVDDLVLCEDELPGTLTAVAEGGLGTVYFEWSKDDVVIPEQNSSTLQVEEEGTYSVVAIGEGIGGAGECRSDEATATVTIYPIVIVDAGVDQSVCSDDPEVTLDGSISGGATTGTWSGGTGSFDPNASTLNAVYTPSAAEIAAGTVTLTLTSTDPEGPCDAEEDEMTITIIGTPDLDPIDAVTACDSYELPALGTISGSNLYSPQYYTDSQANSGVLITDLVLTESQTVWVYDESGTDPNCFDEISFMVTINDTPDLDPIEDVLECDSYTLPDPSTLTGSNLVDPQYYDDSQANGGQLITDYTLSESQTIWVYDETGTDPNCFDEIEFDVVITDSPVADELDDQIACDEFILPELSAGNQYFTGTGGTGDELEAGDAITSTQTIYIYADASEPCVADESSFLVTIYFSPTADDFSNVTSCDSYTLPTLSSGNQYFTGPDATGTELFAGASITSTQTVYVYAEATDPCVADETSFLVTINYTPDLDPIADVTECDEYTLPDPSTITGSNLVDPQYYDNSQANGGQLITDLTLTMSQMVWVYDETGTDPNCFDEISFMVTIEECALEGCTLGYWKNHTNRWCADYGTATLYRSIFTAAPGKYSSLTLLQALNLEGGGVNNLIRQSTAALLNTCSSEVDYAYSDVQALINDVNAAFGGDAGAFATYLDGLNNAGCPLGGTEAYAGPWPLPAEPAAALVADDAAAVAGDVSVYPVPFKDELNLEYKFDYLSDVVVQVFDLRGQLVRSYKDTAVSKGSRSNFKVDFTVLPGQVYVLKVITNRESIVKKVSSSN